MKSSWFPTKRLSYSSFSISAFCSMRLLYSSYKPWLPKLKHQTPIRLEIYASFAFWSAKTNLICSQRCWRCWVNSVSSVLKNSMPNNRLPPSSLYLMRQSKECASQLLLFFSCCANTLLQSNKWWYFTCIRVDAGCYVEVTKCICLMGNMALNFMSALLIWQCIRVGNKNWRSPLSFPHIFQMMNCLL